MRAGQRGDLLCKTGRLISIRMISSCSPRGRLDRLLTALCENHLAAAVRETSARVRRGPFDCLRPAKVEARGSDFRGFPEGLTVCRRALAMPSGVGVLGSELSIFSTRGHAPAVGFS